MPCPFFVIVPRWFDWRYIHSCRLFSSSSWLEIQSLFGWCHSAEKKWHIANMDENSNHAFFSPTHEYICFSLSAVFFCSVFVARLSLPMLLLLNSHSLASSFHYYYHIFSSLCVCLFRSFVLAARTLDSRSLARAPLSHFMMKNGCACCAGAVRTGKQMHELLSQDFTFWCCAVCARRLSFFQIKSTLSGFPFDFPFPAIAEQTTSCIVVAVSVYNCVFFLSADEKNIPARRIASMGKRNAANQIKQDINFNRRVLQRNVKFRMQRGVLCARGTDGWARALHQEPCPAIRKPFISVASDDIPILNGIHWKL